MIHVLVVDTFIAVLVFFMMAFALTVCSFGNRTKSSPCLPISTFTESWGLRARGT